MALQMPESSHLVRAASVAEVEASGRLVVQVDGHAIVLFSHQGRIYAVDNRCPHMGFPLHRGSLHQGILTCHWHHARFDLASGGTFDPWADDVRVFPVEVRDGEVWVDLAQRTDPAEHHRQRLRDGLERAIPLVIAKSAIALLAAGEDPAEPFRIGLEFGARYRQAGWGQGLTILTCLMNLLPCLDPDDRPRALYHGLAAVAADCADSPPRFPLRPLPSASADPEALARVLRRFVEVRDEEGVERCIVSAVRAGADNRRMAAMLGAAATDHRYLSQGHVLDFINKALEALEHAGWQAADLILGSLAGILAGADRMEESGAWRHPVDLVEIVEAACEALPAALEDGRTRRGAYAGTDGLPAVLLGDDPQAIADALLDALRAGCGEVTLAQQVARAAALRIAHFHTSNEFSDWDTALHTFSFAHAVSRMLARAPTVELLRGVFDAAMSVYLDRFLNVPPAPLPEPGGPVPDPHSLLADLEALLDRQQQVHEAAAVVTRYLHSGGERPRLVAALGRLLLREDRNFHAIQMVEAAARQADLAPTDQQAGPFLLAAARYLAAHAPTMRAQEQTYQIALRLHRGERLYVEADRVVATVLVADIAGSTERAAALGDRRWREVLDRFHAMVRREVARHRGTVVDLAGDGVLATFDAAARAIRSALALRDGARRLGLEIRTGLHTGEVEVTGSRVAGICVHLTARVAALAAPGEILATGTVRDLVTGAGFRFADRGEHELRGVPGRWRVLAVQPS